MRHARNRSTPGSRLTVAATLSALAILVAACSGTAAAPAATPAPATPAPATPAPATPAPALTPAASPASTGKASSSPAAPASFESPKYGYTIDLPAGSEVTGVTPATVAWDGTSAIASNGPMVDQFPRTGQRLAFILAAPTELDLDAYAAAIHAKAVREHGCSEEPTATRDFEIDGSPARVVASTCQGLRVYEATTVRDGIGLIAKQITPPPGSPDLEKTSLDDFVWFLEPLRWGAGSAAPTPGGADVTGIDACALITQAEAEAALGVATKPPFGGGTPDVNIRSCMYQSTDGNGPQVGVTVAGAPDAFRAPDASPMPGVGDEAWWWLDPTRGFRLEARDGDRFVAFEFNDFRSAERPTDAALDALVPLMQTALSRLP